MDGGLASMPAAFGQSRSLSQSGDKCATTTSHEQLLQGRHRGVLLTAVFRRERQKMLRVSFWLDRTAAAGWRVGTDALHLCWWIARAGKGGRGDSMCRCVGAR